MPDWAWFKHFFANLTFWSLLPVAACMLQIGDKKMNLVRSLHRNKCNAFRSKYQLGKVNEFPFALSLTFAPNEQKLFPRFFSHPGMAERKVFLSVKLQPVVYSSVTNFFEELSSWLEPQLAGYLHIVKASKLLKTDKMRRARWDEQHFLFFFSFCLLSPYSSDRTLMTWYCCILEAGGKWDSSALLLSGSQYAQNYCIQRINSALQRKREGK